MKAILVGKSKTAAGRMTKNILKSNGLRGWAMDVDAGKFNQAAEQYYRTTLWSDHMEEGLRVLSKDGRQFDREGSQVSGRMGQIVTGGSSVAEFIDRFGSKVLTGKANAGEIQRLILLSLLIIEEKQRQQDKASS